MNHTPRKTWERHYMREKEILASLSEAEKKELQIEPKAETIRYLKTKANLYKSEGNLEAEEHYLMALKDFYSAVDSGSLPL